MARHIPRFYLEKLDGKISEGCSIEISSQQMHHAAKVLRLNVGDIVKVFNEKIGEWRCEIQNLKKNLLKSIIQEKKPHSYNEKKTRIIAVFSLINPAKMSILLEKITELGVTEIIPVVSQYTQHKKFNEEKAKQILIGASEQSGRLDIPKLHNVEKLEDFLNGYDYECKLFIADENLRTEKNGILTTHLEDKCAFLVGPEGGFSDEERKLFEKFPFTEKISLGKNILRSETAAIALASTLCLRLT